MKHIFFLLALLPYCAIGQQEKPAHASAAERFIQLYNDAKYDAIFQLFSPEMQQALPLKKTISFLSDLRQQAGKITRNEFIRYEQSYARYKTQFERALLSILISVDEQSRVNGLFIKPFDIDTNTAAIQRNKTSLILPVQDEWTVFWGGDTKTLNYHVEIRAQQRAFDWVITNEKGVSFKTNGQSNEDFYAFGKPIIAPCDAEVILVVDGIKDNVPGIMNPIYVPGNTVVLKTANGEYQCFAHFKQYTIVVKPGQQIKQGALLGQCGNSGNSSEPHLHFHMQDREDWNTAAGIKCYFENILVNGQPKTDYSPIKGERIRNKAN